MIYKIIMNFDNLERIINKVLKNWNILFYDGILYLSSKKYKSFKEEKMKLLIEDYNIFIEEINENNLNKESPQVKDWCLAYFVEKDLYYYEKKEQKELQKILDQIDKLDLELSKIERG